MAYLSTEIGRRRFGLWLVASAGAGLGLSGCSEGGGGDSSDEQPDCNEDGILDLKDDCNKDGILDDKDQQCCAIRGRSIDTLYDAYQELRPGMSKATVIRLVPVAPFQGADTERVLWVLNSEALGVQFNGAADDSVITFAQWGLTVEAGERTESRAF